VTLLCLLQAFTSLKTPGYLLEPEINGGARPIILRVHFRRRRDMPINLHGGSGGRGSTGCDQS